MEKVEKRQEEEEEEPEAQPLVRARPQPLRARPQPLLPLILLGPRPPRHPPPLSALIPPSPNREAWMAACYVLEQDRLREKQQEQA